MGGVDEDPAGSAVFRPNKQGGQPQDEAIGRSGAAVRHLLGEVEEQGRMAHAKEARAKKASVASAGVARTTHREDMSNPITAGSLDGMAFLPAQMTNSGPLPSGPATSTSSAKGFLANCGGISRAIR